MTDSETLSVSGPPTLRTSHLLVCGLTGGFLQAGLFNPWDRALYLSIKENRPFLSRANFSHPFEGVMQTLVQRAISSGLYFPLEEIFATTFYKSKLWDKNVNDSDDSMQQSKNRSGIAFCSGLLAGAINGIVMNPLTAIKYHYWGTTFKNENFFITAIRMFKYGGMRIFLVGSAATINRDLIFGGVYGLLRHELQANNVELKETVIDQKCLIGDNKKTLMIPNFTSNMIAACIATVFSSPWNYVRNIHYSTPSGQVPSSTYNIWKLLLTEMQTFPHIITKLKFLQTQLRVGWGTARVGFGMAFSSQIYNICSSGEILLVKG
jgi:hypothetical protein